MIPQSFIEELKMHSDIESVVSSYVQLKRRGRILVGLCPFHSEKSGSFTVYPESQSFYCFGCGASGDVIDLAARLFILSSYDAAKKLAADFGIAEQKPSILAKLQRGKSQAETERRCFRVLGDYLRILQDWKEHCAPQSPEDAIDPRYAEACHMLERIGNMLDILACGTPQERAEVVADLQKDDRLMRMEARNRQLREEAHGTK